MFVYRIGSAKYAGDITGEGARLNGGRWNRKHTPCIYTSASRALAVLEYTVNVNIDDIPRALCITTFEIPGLGIREIKEADLPGNWKTIPAPSSTKDFGNRLLETATALVIKIPSIVIPDEFNYIINPLHKNIASVKIFAIGDFIYDVRIKTDVS